MRNKNVIYLGIVGVHVLLTLDQERGVIQLVVNVRNVLTLSDYRHMCGCREREREREQGAITVIDGIKHALTGINLCCLTVVTAALLNASHRSQVGVSQNRSAGGDV